MLVSTLHASINGSLIRLILDPLFMMATNLCFIDYLSKVLLKTLELSTLMGNAGIFVTVRGLSSYTEGV